MLYQEKNRRPFHPRSHGVQTAFTVRNPMQRNFQFFSQSGCKHHWGWVLDNTTRLSSYMKNTVSCSCWKLLLSQFNIQKIRYGEKGFRSIFHVRRNLRISSTVSYFNILLSTIFQVYLLSNKECFSRICDISGTSERILVRITCNSRQTILSCCFELKRENTSRDRKISFEIWRFELWEVTYKSLLGIFTIPEKYFE